MAAVPRVLYLGTGSDYSFAPLAALLAAEMPVCGIITARPSGPRRMGDAGGALRPLSPPATDGLPLLDAGTRRTIAHLGWDHCIPVLAASRVQGLASDPLLISLRPELLCVACFPWILPPDLLALPPQGGVNLHPSHLPENRGPFPLFWTFREGRCAAGVTVHWLDSTVDGGPILLQERVPVPDGIAGATLEQACLESGIPLLLSAIRLIGAGRAPRIPQDPRQATYHSWPAAEDWLVTTNDPARWAYNFLRGVAPWGRAFIMADGRGYSVREALSWAEGATRRERVGLDHNRLTLRMNPGELCVRIGEPGGMSHRAG